MAAGAMAAAATGKATVHLPSSDFLGSKPKFAAKSCSILIQGGGESVDQSSLVPLLLSKKASDGLQVRAMVSSPHFVDRNNLTHVFSVAWGTCAAVGISLGYSRNSLSARQLHSRGGSNVRHSWGRKDGAAGNGGPSQRLGASDTRGRGEQGIKDNNVFEATHPKKHGYPRVGVVDLAQAWEVLRQDVLYLDWRARQDVDTIRVAHDKVVEVLNPLAREQKSVATMRQQLAQLQEDLAHAHNQVHVSESRVEHSLRKLADIESAIKGKSPQNLHTDSIVDASYKNIGSAIAEESMSIESEPSNIQVDRSFTKRLNVSGPLAPYPIGLKNFWYPVAFTNDISIDTLIPFESFEERWVLFRGKDGRVGCVRDECAHRACPLSLGKVSDGRIQCPYHGWEYSTSGECKKMPSVRPTKASVRALPCIERDGMVWIWPGDEIPGSILPSLNPPANFTIHAEIILEMPVEHGLLMENLLDLAHAPFTHTSTFAKGWAVPNFVRFKTPTAALSGNWDPYPIDMEFQPPCMVLSTIGLVKPGQLDGLSTAACPKHLHQLHVCMPSTRGKTRLLYRMALDFAHWAKYVPFIDQLWLYLANQVLNEDLRLVEGQQDRMERGANVWQNPVAYDKLGIRYRLWRKAVESGNRNLSLDSP